jgi:hypothetical protein
MGEQPVLFELARHSLGVRAFRGILSPIFAQKVSNANFLGKLFSPLVNFFTTHHCIATLCTFRSKKVKINFFFDFAAQKFGFLNINSYFCCVELTLVLTSLFQKEYVYVCFG